MTPTLLDEASNETFPHSLGRHAPSVVRQGLAPASDRCAEHSRPWRRLGRRRGQTQSANGCEPTVTVNSRSTVFAVPAMLSVVPFALRRARVGVEVKMLRDEEDTDRKMSEGEEGEAFFWCEALHARVNCRESSLLTLSFAKRVKNQPITSSLFSLCLCNGLGRPSVLM